MRALVLLVVSLGLIVSWAAPVAAAPFDEETRRSERTYDHIFVIVEENTEFSGIIGKPLAVSSVFAFGPIACSGLGIRNRAR